MAKVRPWRKVEAYVVVARARRVPPLKLAKVGVVAPPVWTALARMTPLLRLRKPAWLPADPARLRRRISALPVVSNKAAGPSMLRMP